MTTELTVMEAIAKRRAVRAYKPDKLDEQTIRALLDAAVLAPTAIHEEPWTFVVVQSRDRLKKLSDLAKHRFLERAQLAGRPARGGSHFAEVLTQDDFNIFYDAGTLIVICAKPMGDFAVADCWLAAENLMLAATGKGLGTCPIGFATEALNTPAVKAELGIPPEQTAVAAIIVGVPAGETAPTGRKPPEVLRWC